MACTTCTTTQCVSLYGCPDASSGICPDFRIKRFDTHPAFEEIVKDCNLPIDLTDTVVEASMWAAAKFKKAVSDTDTYFQLADNIGFFQAVVGDIIVVAGSPRTPEQMLVTGFDESNYYIRVQRGYNGTSQCNYKRGTAIRIFRFMNATGSTEMTYTDVPQMDGTTENNVLTQSKLIYDWSSQDTCLPGCYYLELKLLKMLTTNETSLHLTGDTSSVIPSFITPSAATLGCELGVGVEWVRRFPVESEGYFVQIVDSPTSERLLS